MNVPNKYFIVFATLIVASFILKLLLPFAIKVHIFLTLELIQILLLAYLIYSFFEMKVLKEKQGSKLAKTRQKLYSSTWD